MLPVLCGLLAFPTQSQAQGTHYDDGFDIEPQAMPQTTPNSGYTAPAAATPPVSPPIVQPQAQPLPRGYVPSPAYTTHDGYDQQPPDSIPMQALPGQRVNQPYTTRDVAPAPAYTAPSAVPVAAPAAAPVNEAGSLPDAAPATPVDTTTTATETPAAAATPATTETPATATTDAKAASDKPAEGDTAQPDVTQKHFTSIRLQGLEKITARREEFDAIIGAVTRFENLEIIPRACWEAPETSQHPETAALLEVWYWKPGDKPALLFFGWMFASSPGLSSLEHAVYDLTVLKCLTEEAPEQPDAPDAEATDGKDADSKKDKKAATAKEKAKKDAAKKPEDAAAATEDSVEAGD